MNLKEKLDRFDFLEEEINSDIEQIKCLMANAERTTKSLQLVYIYSGDTPGRRIEGPVAEIDRISRKIEKENKEYDRLRAEISRRFNELPNKKMRDVLSKYYFGRMTPAEIADSMNMSVRWVYNMLTEARRLAEQEAA